MKKIKYILTLILFIIQILLLNELFILHLYYFIHNVDYTTFYLPGDNSISVQTMLQDIKNEALANDIDVFAIDFYSEGLLSENMTIYSTSGVEEYLKNNYDVFSGEFKSIFSGKINISFSEITNLADLDGIETYYLIGDKDNQITFKQALVNTYAGKFPKDGVKNDTNKLIIIFIWFIITILIVVITYYQILFMKKEVLIKISFGENVRNIILKEFFSHTAILLGVFFVTRYIFLKCSYVIFYDKLNIVCALVSIIGSGGLYLLFKFTDIKECFSNVVLSKKILKFSYILKVLSVLMLPIILSSNIYQIATGLEFYKQKEFFNNHKDYYYISFNFPFSVVEDFSQSQDKVKALNIDFYKKFYDEFKPEYSYASQLNDTTENNIIIINDNAKYLLDDIIDTTQITNEYDYYLFIPQNNQTDVNQIEQLLINDIKHTLISLNPTTNYNGSIATKEDHIKDFSYKTITYSKNAEILSISNTTDNLSLYSKNPYIIYINDDLNNILITLENAPYVMYKINQEGIQSFCEENNFDEIDWSINTQNVNDYYLYMLSKYKRIILLNSIVVLLVMVIELIIISTIIKLEYKVNAIELSIKKVLGYTLLQRNKSIVVLIGISFGICMISSCIINLVTDFIEIKYFLISNVIVLCMELIVVIFNIKKIEKTNIARILKGDNI